MERKNAGSESIECAINRLSERASEWLTVDRASNKRLSERQVRERASELSEKSTRASAFFFKRRGERSETGEAKRRVRWPNPPILDQTRAGVVIRTQNTDMETVTGEAGGTGRDESIHSIGISRCRPSVTRAAFDREEALHGGGAGTGN